MNNVLTNDNTTMNNSGEICRRKLAAFYNKSKHSLPYSQNCPIQIHQEKKR